MERTLSYFIGSIINTQRAEARFLFLVSLSLSVVLVWGSVLVRRRLCSRTVGVSGRKSLVSMRFLGCRPMSAWALLDVSVCGVAKVQSAKCESVKCATLQSTVIRSIVLRMTCSLLNLMSSSEFCRSR